MHHPLSPAATFERRIRAVVRRLQRLHPKKPRTELMLQARMIPPADVVQTMHRLSYFIKRQKQRQRLLQT